MNSDNIIRSSLPPIEYPNITVGEFLASTLSRENPNKVAIIDPNTDAKLSYGELHFKAEQFAAALVKLGVTNSDLVMLFADNCIEHVVALYGTFYLGAVPLTQSKPANGPFEMVEQLRDSKATVLVFGKNQKTVLETATRSAEYASSLKQLKFLVALNDEEQSLKDIEVLKGKTIISFNELLLSTHQESSYTIPLFPVTDLKRTHALIVYTSGTSGKPKGAIHTHWSYVACLCTLRVPKHLEGFKLALQLPLGHLSGTIFVPQALIAGMTVVLFSDSAIVPILESVHKYRIEVAFFTANVASQLITEHDQFSSTFDLSCLKAFRYGGSKIADHLLREIQAKYGTEIWNVYGSTEMVGSVDTIDRNRAAPGPHFVPGCLGVPLSNIELKIVDLKDGKTALSPGEMGEMCFRGPTRFFAYLNNETATRETIDSEGWYHTGDCGRWEPQNGGLFAVERLKELVKFRLWSVVPAEVEHFLLQSIAAIKEVIVVGVPHQTDVQWLRAYVQCEEGSSVRETDVVDVVKKNMGFQKQLRAGVRFIEKMPRTALEKIDRAYFKKLVQQELLTEVCED